MIRVGDRVVFVPNDDDINEDIWYKVIAYNWKTNRMDVINPLGHVYKNQSADGFMKIMNANDILKGLL